MEARAAGGLVDVLELISLIKGSNFDAWRILITKFDARKSVTKLRRPRTKLIVGDFFSALFPVLVAESAE